MSSKKNKKTRRPQRRKHPQLKTLLAITLMLGTILAGLLILSHQPVTQRTDIDRGKSPALPLPHGLQPEGTNGSYPEPSTADRSAEMRDKPQTTSILAPVSLPAQPKVAIIMDDLGANLEVAQRAAALDSHITLAIIPDLRYANKTMHIAAQHAKEVMVHLPMEPINYPDHNPGEMALMLDMNDVELRRRTAYYLQKLPLAKGCNNHMGSAFTQAPHQMATVLEQLSARGLYFVDSLTSATSVGAEQARILAVPSTTRDVFLDNERDVEKITSQLTKLLRIAQKNGSAIGICHPYPETMVVLDNCASLAAKYGVEVVPASQLVR